MLRWQWEYIVSYLATKNKSQTWTWKDWKLSIPQQFLIVGKSGISADELVSKFGCFSFLLNSSCLLKTSYMPAHLTSVFKSCEKSKNTTLIFPTEHNQLESHTLLYPHCLPGIAACRKAGYRTRIPHFPLSPKSLSWHSSPTVQVGACSPSSIYCFSSEATIGKTRKKLQG